jgi:hypothetical protein
MSALPPIADIQGEVVECLLLTQSGHRLSSDTAPLSPDTLPIAAGLSCRAGMSGGARGGRRSSSQPRREDAPKASPGRSGSFELAQIEVDLEKRDKLYSFFYITIHRNMRNISNYC